MGTATGIVKRVDHHQYKYQKQDRAESYGRCTCLDDNSRFLGRIWRHHAKSRFCQKVRTLFANKNHAFCRGLPLLDKRFRQHRSL